MTDAQINDLLRKRDRLLTRRDGLYDRDVIDRIDKQLATVEPGTDNRVDLALGRLCAKLERRGYIDSDRDLTKINRMADAMQARHGAAQVADYSTDWTCNLCGISQPGWAGDCLTCETQPMMGDRE
jgi:hypothetical protein